MLTHHALHASPTHTCTRARRKYPDTTSVRRGGRQCLIQLKHESVCVENNTVCYACKTCERTTTGGRGGAYWNEAI